jgi:hypothetical protein
MYAFGFVGLVRMIILRWIVDKQFMNMWYEFIWLEKAYRA